MELIWPMACSLVENIESWQRGLLVFSVYHTPNDVASIAPLSITAPESEFLFEWTKFNCAALREASDEGGAQSGTIDVVGLRAAFATTNQSETFDDDEEMKHEQLASI